MQALLRIWPPAVLIIAVAGLVMALSGCRQDTSPAGTEPVTHAGSDDARPTIILIYADDLDWESLTHDWPAAGSGDPSHTSVMFPTLREMAQSGVVLDNFHITTPVCGPSRATLLSGQYAHRNGVRVNDPGNWISNGFPGGAREFDPAHSLAPWMKQAGYQNCFVGKYLHHEYAPRGDQGESWESIRPPGWDWFQPALGARYYDYWLLDDQTRVPRQIREQYRTDSETDEICGLLKAWDPRQGPQFICWLTVAPHIDISETGMSAARHAEEFSDSLPPDLDRHLSDRHPSLPEELRVMPDCGEVYREEILRSWRDRLRATRALDEGLARIRRQLQDAGRLENTIFVFSSDHGFRLGQHGHVGKRLPYDRITRVPTFVCGAGIAQGVSHEVLANIDLAPTLVDLAGGRIPESPAQVDGQSFAALLKNPAAQLDPPRAGVLLEHWETEINADTIEIPAAWSAWRTRDHIYTEWATGGREYYDLKNDPEQMHNLYAELPTARREALRQALRESRYFQQPPLVAEMLARHDIMLNVPVSANFEPLPLSGYVESAAGIQSTELEFVCTRTNEFWDGTGWTEHPTRVSASLDNPNGQLTRWSFSFDNSKNLTAEVPIPEREVRVSVFARDNSDQESSHTFESLLTMRFDDPESWIDTPENLQDGCRPLRVTGRARDNTQVQRVLLVINDKSTGKFWDGSEWVTDYTTVETDLEPGALENEVIWSYELTARSTNRVFVGSRAIDDRRNYERVLPFFEFLPVDSGDPSANDSKSAGQN